MGNWPTQPPAGNLVVYLPVAFYFRDPVECAAKILQYNAGFLPGIYIPGVQLGPQTMAFAEGVDTTKFGWGVDTASKWIEIGPSVLEAPLHGAPPFIVAGSTGSVAGWAPPFPVQGYVAYPANGSGNIYWWPPLSHTFDYTQDWFVVPGHTNVPVYGTGRDITYIWVMIFMNGGGGPTVPVGLDQMRPRRFIGGFEMTRGGEGSFSNPPEGGSETAECYSRDASRTPDGVGIAFRDGNSAGLSKNLDEFFSPIQNAVNSWERFYMRVRQYPIGDTRFWEANTTSANSAVKLGMNATGNLLIWTENNIGTEFFRGTSAGTIPLNTWVRVDLYVIFKPRHTVGAVPPCEVAGASSGNQGFLDVYINKALFMQANGTTHDGFGVNFQTHSRSSFDVDPGTNDLELDIDDWANMDPGPCTAPTFQNTLDWLYGQHVQRIRPIGPGAGHAASWTNTYRTLLQEPAWRASALANSWMSSAVASARLEMDTEMDGEETLGPLRQLGCLSLVSGYVNAPSAAGTNGQVGYSIGGVTTLRTVVESAAINGYSALANIAAGNMNMPALTASEPLDLVHVHATDIITDNIAEFQAVAQFMGSWGPEDDASTGAPGQIPGLGVHNGHYLTSLVGPGHASVLQGAPVAVATGTYLGTGLGQDVSINLPFVHWLYIRNTTTNDITWWWSSMLGPHFNLSTFNILPNNMVRLVRQANGTTLLQLAGNHVGGNASGTTYQYMAFCDPSSKVLINGAFKHGSGANYNNLLFDSVFQPEAGFFVMESTENTLTGDGIYFKGPGSTGSSNFGISPLNAAQVDGARWDLQAGLIRSTGALHSAVISQCAYAAFRQDDGTNSFPVFAGSYIGNGAGGTRGIAVALRGRRPIWAYVQGLNAGGFVRDPSHTGSNSTAGGGTTVSTTAIVGGGPDLINVGTTLNANLIVYNVFIVPSPSTAFPGNNGWDANEAGGLTPPGWDPDVIIGPTGPSWPPTLPPSGLPEGVVGCVVTFGSGTDSGGGSGCGVTL